MSDEISDQKQSSDKESDLSSNGKKEDPAEIAQVCDVTIAMIVMAETAARCGGAWRL